MKKFDSFFLKYGNSVFFFLSALFFEWRMNEENFGKAGYWFLMGLLSIQLILHDLNKKF